jgi:cell division protease FtsH
MKFVISAVMGLLLSEQALAFAPHTPVAKKYSSSGRFMAMDVDLPPAASSDAPVIQKSTYGPTDVRYSDFLSLVDSDKIEKVTFSADGSQLLGVDVDGTRIKIEALPNDPDLLTQLTSHKVRT